MSTDRSALPKYLQLSELLLREIAAGRLRVGDRLPPERAMADDMGVAVGTLRKALSRLADQGVIARQQGSGNYIKDTGQGTGIYSFFRLERRDGGGLPRARVLEVARCAKTPDLPDFGTAPDAHRIRRLRLLDELVVAAEEIWLDGAYAAQLSAHDLSESLYLFYRMRLGLWIAGVEDRIGIGDVPRWGADIGLTGGAPCGLVDRVSTAPDGTRAEVSRTWFNPARAVYVARSR
ncbi:GntR family transcriptional regulator [Meridianimarinicoccus roseus]|uniref:GntR family transcriptional regulator n=1 Tax=Meridianimarinicoccus roseus TaxID=2072018 RepID=A0A2V2LEH4_9RHOB|nr:GntR family transcriptional regulator [Meridianimarinicoccus roseus]PWR02261.1 GntR family transcriptional regulator [Meridianimarinicoccus roseus]